MFGCRILCLGVSLTPGGFFPSRVFIRPGGVLTAVPGPEGGAAPFGTRGNGSSLTPRCSPRRLLPALPPFPLSSYMGWSLFRTSFLGLLLIQGSEFSLRHFFLLQNLFFYFHLVVSRFIQMIR